MSLYDSLIFLKAVINLSQRAWSIVKQPASLSQQYLGLCKS